MNRPLLAFAGLIVAGGTAAGVYVGSPGGGEEEVVQQVATSPPSANVSPTSVEIASPSPETTKPGETLWRWVDVTISIRDGSGISVNPAFFLPPNANPSEIVPALELILFADDGSGSNLWLDAQNAAVLADNVLDRDRPAFDAVVKSAVVSPLDPTTAGWPLSSEAPQGVTRQVWGGISYVAPAPTTGLYVYTGIAEPSGHFVAMKNGRSVIFVRSGASEIDQAVDSSKVLSDDAATFERWLADIKFCGEVNQC